MLPRVHIINAHHVPNRTDSQTSGERLSSKEHLKQLFHHHRTHRTNRTHRTHRAHRTHRTHRTHKAQRTHRTHRTYRTHRAHRTYRTHRAQRTHPPSPFQLPSLAALPIKPQRRDKTELTFPLRAKATNLKICRKSDFDIMSLGINSLPAETLLNSQSIRNRVPYKYTGLS